MVMTKTPNPGGNIEGQRADRVIYDEARMFMWHTPIADEAHTFVSGRASREYRFPLPEPIEVDKGDELFLACDPASGGNSTVIAVRKQDGTVRTFSFTPIEPFTPSKEDNTMPNESDFGYAGSTEEREAHHANSDYEQARAAAEELGNKIHESFEKVAHGLHEAFHSTASTTSTASTASTAVGSDGAPFYGVSLYSQTPPPGRERRFRLDYPSAKGHPLTTGDLSGDELVEKVNDLLQSANNRRTSAVEKGQAASQLMIGLDEIKKNIVRMVRADAAAEEEHQRALRELARIAEQEEQERRDAQRPVEPAPSVSTSLENVVPIPTVVTFQKLFGVRSGKLYTYAAVRTQNQVGGYFWSITGRGAKTNISWGELVDFLLEKEDSDSMRLRALRSLQVVSGGDTRAFGPMPYRLRAGNGRIV